mgnify:CR=1 FL=1
MATSSSSTRTASLAARWMARSCCRAFEKSLSSSCCKMNPVLAVGRLARLEQLPPTTLERALGDASSSARLASAPPPARPIWPDLRTQEVDVRGGVCAVRRCLLSPVSGPRSALLSASGELLLALLHPRSHVQPPRLLACVLVRLDLARLALVPVLRQPRPRPRLDLGHLAYGRRQRQASAPEGFLVEGSLLRRLHQGQACGASPSLRNRARELATLGADLTARSQCNLQEPCSSCWTREVSCTYTAVNPQARLGRLLAIEAADVECVLPPLALLPFGEAFSLTSSLFLLQTHHRSAQPAQRERQTLAPHRRAQDAPRPERPRARTPAAARQREDARRQAVRRHAAVQQQVRPLGGSGAVGEGRRAVRKKPAAVAAAELRLDARCADRSVDVTVGARRSSVAPTAQARSQRRRRQLGRRGRARARRRRFGRRDAAASHRSDPPPATSRLDSPRLPRPLDRRTRFSIRRADRQPAAAPSLRPFRPPLPGRRLPFPALLPHAAPGADACAPGVDEPAPPDAVPGPARPARPQVVGRAAPRAAAALALGAGPADDGTCAWARGRAGGAGRGGRRVVAAGGRAVGRGASRRLALRNGFQDGRRAERELWDVVSSCNAASPLFTVLARRPRGPRPPTLLVRWTVLLLSSLPPSDWLLAPRSSCSTLSSRGDWRMSCCRRHRLERPPPRAPARPQR